MEAGDLERRVERRVERRGYRIKGRVQGVFFRVWTRETATDLGLRGSVRNLPDGSVEAFAEGPVHVLDAFEKLLGKGPPASRVREVERREGGDPLDQDGFHILQ